MRTKDFSAILHQDQSTEYIREAFSQLLHWGREQSESFPLYKRGATKEDSLHSFLSFRRKVRKCAFHFRSTDVPLPDILPSFLGGRLSTMIDLQAFSCSFFPEGQKRTVFRDCPRSSWKTSADISSSEWSNAPPRLPNTRITLHAICTGGSINRISVTVGLNRFGPFGNQGPP